MSSAMQRLDLLAQMYESAPKIRELIALCCQKKPGTRPTMNEVLQILGGEQWANLQEARQRQGLTAACAVVGLAALFLAIVD